MFVSMRSLALLSLSLTAKALSGDVPLWGRNLSLAAPELAQSAAIGNGRSFFYLGALLAVGEPEASRSARFQVSEEGSIEFQWALGLSLAEGLPALDRPALAYYVGSEKHDPLATLAFSYYVFNGLTLGSSPWWRGTEAVPSLSREPQEGEVPLPLCQLTLRALQDVAEAAAMNEDGASDAASDLNFFVQNASEVRRLKKEHADWILARSRDGFKSAEISEAAYFIHGDADLELRPDALRAAALLESAAASSGEAAYLAMLLQAREGDEEQILDKAQLVIQDPKAPSMQKAMAQHYLHRFGGAANATLAGAYLLAAAQLGEPNAQQTLAHAYAGLGVPEPGVQVPGAPNTNRALHFYSLAAKQGRPVSAVNAVALMLRQPGEMTSTRCRKAAETLREVALAYHPDVLQLYSRARKAALSDASTPDALLAFTLLSELGAKNAHTNAAALAKETQSLCWRPQPACEIDYLRRAAWSGSTDAMLRLAALLQRTKDLEGGWRWTKRAEQAGSAEAKLAAGYLQAYGVGTEQDLSGACSAYCSFLREEEPLLARGLAFFQVLRLRLVSGDACCDLPDAGPWAPVGAMLAIVASTSAAAACLS
ncbi:unnamed protein product [Effrenium voratum]|nr:unnamed protein product [Effrenium voratum]